MNFVLPIAILAAPSTSATGAVPIPLSTGWVEGFLLMIVWLFVAAVIIGPLVTFFRLGPRSAQLFTDDRKIRSH